MTDFTTLLFGLGISFFAGLATSIGAGVVYFIKFEEDRLAKILSVTLGLSAGVMIAISVFELIPYTLEQTDFISTNAAFFAGFIILMIVDFLIPHRYEAENASGSFGILERDKTITEQKNNAKRVGYLTALGIAIHNLPEGITSFSGFIISPLLGITTAIAIAIHNIPEGLSVSVPLVSSGQSKNKAFLIGSFSGLMEPIGAIIALLFLLPIMNEIGTPLALILAFVAGIMIFISIDELLPMAFKYNNHELTTFSILIGMGIMVLTLFVLE